MLLIAAFYWEEDIMPNDAVIEKFKMSLRGELIQPSDERYDEARKLWNGMFDRRPALIARCAGTADVVSAANFSRVNRSLVAVRGGGHSFQATLSATEASSSTSLALSARTMER
jgi:hypothetical protein